MTRITALIRSYTTLLPCFRIADIADIVKQPVNFINKSKRYVKKKINNLGKEHPAFSQVNLEKTHSFAGDSCQKLGSTKDVLVHFKNNCCLRRVNTEMILDQHLLCLGGVNVS